MMTSGGCDIDELAVLAEATPDALYVYAKARICLPNKAGVRRQRRMIPRVKSLLIQSYEPSDLTFSANFLPME